ncbi:hypothetical protein TNCT_511091 [Trichonephila clavata]|uniref:Nucleolin n=1 Tax=Trichonephila clavata TaxID=2740835 RepID=A0A8X6IZB6_TRICU|nr:hypothetical protein TNCT_511091 [Trichonephila clavata]
MVLHKKAAGPSKRAQGKRAFEDNDSDSDFDGDSGEEMVVQKTPKNKTPQGRNSQSMSAKKVSFELSGKKTPQKNISFVGKKQPTPVAKGVKENKGVQKKKPQSEEMDVDDEDEDDDDFELDMDEDDDDDDDEEEDEEDDDEEEDEDEEEQEQIQKQKSNSKQPKNVTTPMKGADTSKKLTTPKAKTPKNEIKKKNGNSEEEDDSDDSAEDEEEEQIQKQKNVKTPKANSPRNKEMATVLEMDAIRRREIEIKTLYVGNLSTDVTPDDLKALSPDITEVFAQKNSKSPRR